MSLLKSVKCLWINYRWEDMLDALHQKCISDFLIAARKEGINYISKCIQTKIEKKINQRMSQISVGNGAVLNGDSNTIICSRNINGVLPAKSKLEIKLHYKPQLQHLWFGVSAKSEKHSCKRRTEKRKQLIGWLVDEVGGLAIVGLWEGHRGGWWAVIG